METGRFSQNSNESLASAQLASLKDAVRRRTEAGVYTAMGYSSNLDLILDFRAEKLSELLALYLPDADLYSLKNVRRIRTIEELLSTIVYFCRSGIGGEADIDEPSLLRENFPCAPAMGGTGVQAAMALSKIGCHTVVHLTDDSREVREILGTPFIHAVREDGTLVGTMDIEGHNPQEIHLILQFKKGDKIRLGEQTAEIPWSNRLILTKNTINESLPLYEPYFRWVEDHAPEVSSNLLSSFNALQDPALLLNRLETVRAHAEKYHQRNPKGIVYFEDAHYHNDEIRGMCMDIIYPHVDIMSMNEEELLYTLEHSFEQPVDIDDILSCAGGADYLRKRYLVRKGVVVHTKDYAMYVGSPSGMNIRNGLEFGSLMATSKACFGDYGGEKEILEILKLPFSEKGLECVEKIRNSEWKDRVVIVPTRYIDKPKYTIGLGDSFTGGMQLSF